ncbi:DMT family transporter [Mesobacterium pallidum]|uniref:DMT family transporter n=1 Tax=Mesobacterium pallidum TaxID=2872037 RepID=UPI001EE2697D|nr:DMT family transporter [Mesobacterium pallidum]
MTQPITPATPAPETPPSPPSERRNAMLAIGLILGALIGFDLMGVLVKMLIPRYAPQELAAYRNVLGVLPSVMLMLYTGELRLRGSRLKLRQWRLAVVRGIVVAVAQIFWYAALGYLELATIASLAQTNALFSVLLGIVIFGDRVGPWRWTAIGVGFVGVLLILRPGAEAFSPYALMPIAAAVCYAYSAVTMRHFDDDASNALIYLYSAGASGIGAILLAAVTTDFSPIQSGWDAAAIFAMAMLGGSAVLLMMLAYRLTTPAVLAPFGYLGILTSFALGYIFFGEAPIETLFPGVLLVVAAGGIILWRQNR